MRVFSHKLVLAAAISLASSLSAQAQDDALYAKAKEEGTVIVYSATDSAQVQTLIEAFTKKYPDIKVDYNDVGTTGTYNKVVAEYAAGQVSTDLVWSSSMNLQMQMAMDGLFETVKLTERPNLPDWAVYKDILYATSIEPIGILYNKIELKEDQVPKTRAQLIEFLKTDQAKGRVGALDPERSGSGLLIDMNDMMSNDNFWDVAKAFGAAEGKVYASNGPVREAVGSGENILAFNIIGSYAFDWAKTSPSLGVVFDPERTAAFVRPIALMKGAPHPNAGQLFMDFLLSREGQTELAKNTLPSVRSDLDPANFDQNSLGYDSESVNKRIGGHMIPIPLDETLVTEMTAQRPDFVKKWQEAMGR